MNDSLRDQLIKSRLVPKKEAAEIKAQQQLDDEETERRSIRSHIIDGETLLIRLAEAKSIHEFRLQAKLILEMDPNQIGDVVRETHKFVATDYPGKDRYLGKKIVWFFLELKKRLEKTPTSRQRELKKAFRRHNPTLDLD